MSISQGLLPFHLSECFQGEVNRDILVATIGEGDCEKIWNGRRLREEVLKEYTYKELGYAL